MFSQACVNNPVHREGGVQAQAQAQGGSAWGVSRPRPGGVQAQAWGGCAQAQAQGGGCVSQHALSQTPLQQTATAADGTHPTGMHSCSQMQKYFPSYIE